jgi:hypothetical protein
MEIHSKGLDRIVRWKTEMEMPHVRVSLSSSEDFRGAVVHLVRVFLTVWKKDSSEVAPY